MKNASGPVLVDGDTLEGHLRNALTMFSLKRQLGEPLTPAELDALERRLLNAIGCLEIARQLTP